MGTYSCGTMPLNTTIAPEQPEGEQYSSVTGAMAKDGTKDENGHEKKSGHLIN